MFTETLWYAPESLWKQLPYSVKVHMQDISLWYIGGGRGREEEGWRGRIERMGGREEREEGRRKEEEKKRREVGEGWVGQREEYYALP